MLTHSIQLQRKMSISAQRYFRNRVLSVIAGFSCNKNNENINRYTCKSLLTFTYCSYFINSLKKFTHNSLLKNKYFIQRCAKTVNVQTHINNTKTGYLNKVAERTVQVCKAQSLFLWYKITRSGAVQWCRRRLQHHQAIKITMIWTGPETVSAEALTV